MNDIIAVALLMTCHP